MSMSNQQKSAATAATTSTTTSVEEQEGLSKEEQEEMKALQDERKVAGEGKNGAQFTDSHRVRLSELLKKEADAKEAKKAAKAESKK